MTRTLRVAVAEDERDTREYLQEILTRLGHQVVTAQNGKQLAEQCRILHPDLVLTDVRMPDMDGIDAANAINAEQETPVILVTAHHDPQTLARAEADNVMAYLIKPVSPADVEASIGLAMRRFEQLHASRREAADLRQALEDRKLIERAKGIVMRRLRVDEEDAYRRLRRVASDRNLKLVALARTIIDAEEVFQPLERAGSV
ncbi:MAG TPA: response regulator [Gemmataceae bacterium]|nr:response regulator [Gemmataceae bacterium]